MPMGIEERARTTLRFLKRKTEECERLKEEIGNPPVSSGGCHAPA